MYKVWLEWKENKWERGTYRKGAIVRNEMIAFILVLLKCVLWPFSLPGVVRFDCLLQRLSWLEHVVCMYEKNKMGVVLRFLIVCHLMCCGHAIGIFGLQRNYIAIYIIVTMGPCGYKHVVVLATEINKWEIRWRNCEYNLVCLVCVHYNNIMYLMRIKYFINNAQSIYVGVLISAF